MIETVQILEIGNGESNQQINVCLRAYMQSLKRDLNSFIGYGLGTDVLQF